MRTVDDFKVGDIIRTVPVLRSLNGHRFVITHILHNHLSIKAVPDFNLDGTATFNEVFCADRPGLNITANEILDPFMTAALDAIEEHERQTAL